MRGDPILCSNLDISGLYTVILMGSLSFKCFDNLIGHFCSLISAYLKMSAMYAVFVVCWSSLCLSKVK